MNNDYVVESMLLSASVDFPIEGRILDIGVGSGTTSISLAKRFKHINIVGLEAYWENIKGINENIEINEMRNRIQIFQCDLIVPPPRFAAGTFSYIFVNGFFLKHVAIEVLVKFVLLMIKTQGVITFLISPSQLNSILYLCFEKIGNIKIFPVYKQMNMDADFIILQGIKGESKTPLRLFSGLTLYNEKNCFSSDAEKIIYHNASLEIVS